VCGSLTQNVAVPILFLTLIVAVGLGASIVAVLPAWLRVRLLRSLERGQQRARKTGERNTYFAPESDPARLLGQLRVMAGVVVLICVGLVAVAAVAT